MSDDSNNHNLAEKIAEFLESGIPLSDEVMHAIDDSFSSLGANELFELLYDPSNCEADAIIELIFYPDLSFQEKIEPVLMTRSYALADVESIARSLILKNLRVPVILPHDRGLMTIDLTESIIRQMLTRLHIDRQIDPRLANALATRVKEPAEQLRLRVLLRNCTRAFSDTACDFLSAWIEKMYGTSPYFAEAFRFLLDFFDDAASEDIYPLLMKGKKALVQQIAQGEKCDAALQNHHVEALMLRGMPLLCVNITDIRKKIMLIDHICQSMFGKTEMLDLPYSDQD